MASSKDKDLSRWKDRLHVANRKFDKEVKDNIRRWRDYYRGKQWHGENTMYEDQIVVNMVFQNMRTILPAINFRNPRIYATAKKKPYRVEGNQLYDTLQGAMVLEMILNHYYNELSVKRQADKTLLDAGLGPWGIMRIGYTTESEKVQDDNLLEINELIRSESVYAVRISPNDFRVDPEAVDSHLEDARWVAYRWVKTVEDVKRNPRYKNVHNIKKNFTVKTDFSKGTQTVGESRLYGSEATEWDRVEGWDIWDKKEHRLITIVDDHDKLIQEADWPLDYEGFDCEILYFNENPDELIPISDVDIYMGQQDELNRVSSLGLTHVRNVASQKYGVQENMVDQQELRNLTHGPPTSIITTKGKPQESIHAYKTQVVSQDIYMWRNMMKSDIREAYGSAAFERGAAEKFDTATEPALIAQSINLPREERRAIFEEFIKRVVRKMGQVLQQTLTKRDFALTQGQFEEAQKGMPSKLEKIVGPEGSTIIAPFFNASKDDIQGEYDYALEVGSMQPVNQRERKQDAITLYRLLQENPLINQLEGTKQLLEAFERKDLEKLIRDPKEVAQEAQQAQQQALQSQIAVDQPKRDTDLKKTVIKSQTSKEIEGSKSRTTLLTALIGKNGGKEKK